MGAPPALDRCSLSDYAQAGCFSQLVTHEGGRNGRITQAGVPFPAQFNEAESHRHCHGIYGSLIDDEVDALRHLAFNLCGSPQVAAALGH